VSLNVGANYYDDSGNPVSNPAASVNSPFSAAGYTGYTSDGNGGPSTDAAQQVPGGTPSSAAVTPLQADLATAKTPGERRMRNEINNIEQRHSQDTDAQKAEQEHRLQARVQRMQKRMQLMQAELAKWQAEDQQDPKAAAAQQAADATQSPAPPSAA
jgi:hypothetical protein